MQSTDFGDYLKELRQSKKLTLRQVRDMSGVSDSYLSHIEKGTRGIPSPEILKKLAPVYGVLYEILANRAGYLFDENSPEITIKVPLRNRKSIIEIIETIKNFPEKELKRLMSISKSFSSDDDNDE